MSPKITAKATRVLGDHPIAGPRGQTFAPERGSVPVGSRPGRSRNRLAIVVGTRPEIIKMAPIIRRLEAAKADYFVLHTGQHYSYEMDRAFFEQLDLPDPRVNLDVRSGSHADQTARMLVGIERVLLDERPDLMLVEGDTNTVLAAVIAASKLTIRIGHVEAGLRSRDRRMPEEINRVMADHGSDYLFAPTVQARQNLVAEGIAERRIWVTGNTIVDALQEGLTSKHSNGILSRLGLSPRSYAVVTLHRQENVDNGGVLKRMVKALELVSGELRIPVLFLAHPRTKGRLAQFGIEVNHGVKLIAPQDYLNFITLEAEAALVLTDSGGVQEEACILRVPCVTMRENTERPETVEVGANRVAGMEPSDVLAAAKEMIERDRNWPNPFGDGRAAERILDVVLAAR